MEISSKPTRSKTNRPKAGSWKKFLRDLPVPSYFESCKTIADFNYIGFLRFSESGPITKDQCELQWNEALDQLMLSDHNGLQKKAISLKKQWKNKVHVDEADVFWSKVKRKRRLDRGTLGVQEAVDAYWNKRIRNEYEQGIDDISDETSETPAGSSTNDSVPASSLDPQGEPDDQEPEGHGSEQDNQEQLSNVEIDDLRSNLERACHQECDTDAEGGCVACLFKVYQSDCIDALESGDLRKAEIADVMQRVFGATLDNLVPSVRLPKPDINDSAVMDAVRYWINGDLDSASEALRPLHRKQRIMLESLMDKLPHKADRTIAEGTFVADYVSPIIHGTLGIDDRNLSIHFPNTDSKLQKLQGVKADRPDILIKVRGHEILFGEVIGPMQANNTAKCAWDLFKLTRFAKSVLEAGNRVAPMVQVTYTSGSYLRLYIRTRGMFVLQEVGYFDVPNSISRIPSLIGTLPALLVAQDDVRTILKSLPNERRLSWRFKDVPDLKQNVH
ncbi:hypothetical protein BGX34_001914 [Mortierella sp. NVP85]|nr:hypothetical protein BGX34_001914 [Mortierella sp. NVP85]